MGVVTVIECRGGFKSWGGGGVGAGTCDGMFLGRLILRGRFGGGGSFSSNIFWDTFKTPNNGNKLLELVYKHVRCKNFLGSKYCL